MNVNSLRADIDRKYRVIFGTTEDGTVEIVDINNHCQ